MREYEGLGIGMQSCLVQRTIRCFRQGNSKVHPYLLYLFVLRHKSQIKGLELELTFKKSIKKQLEHNLEICFRSYVALEYAKQISILPHH